MIEFSDNDKTYRIPGNLNTFQLEMYIHLINWKWSYISNDPGYYKNLPYDAILPESVMDSFPVIYPAAVETLKRHHKEFPFRFHRHFHHVVSSQAANFNLFLPLMIHPLINEVFKQLKLDFAELAVNELDHGFKLEFWGVSEGPGLLGDHTAFSGTDSDIAIAYYNKQGELCLWLIEHKLTEKEFTECHAATSRNRNPDHHDCNKTFLEILENKDLCYYHDVRCFKYWGITEQHRDFFFNHGQYKECPFRSGMNQLWRNQLLAFALEDASAQPYQKVYFSVVKHPKNTFLDRTISDYKNLVGNNEKFSAFTSADVINAAATLNDPDLNSWITWYKDLYKLK